MTRELETFQEWLSKAGTKEELGLSLLATYALLKENHRIFSDAAFNVTKDAFERALFDKGFKPEAITFASDEDLSMGGRRLTAVVQATQGSSAEEYLPVLYNETSKLFNQVKQWENKSLWQYIRFVIWRLFHRDLLR